MKARVIVASNRAAAGVYEDETGPMIVAALTSWGFDVPAADVVGDGDPVADAFTRALAESPDAILTTGGTGANPTDRTPEATRPFLDRELPGIAESIRAYGVAHGIPTAMLSRGLAGVAGSTVVVNLPGSKGGVKDGLAVLETVLPHLVDQVGGGDHRRTHMGQT